MTKYITADEDIDTKDIIYALTGALPAAVDSLQNLELPVFTSPEQVAEFLQQNVEYKEDGLEEQIIQLPTALLESKIGDCKSFSLFIAAILTKYDVRNGFRFVAYSPGDVTHVYNYYIDNNENYIYLDACLNDLQENSNFTKKIDMQVGLIGNVPIVYKNNGKIGSRIGFNPSTIYLSLPRQAYLALLKVNYRGQATALAQMRQNHADGINPGPWLNMIRVWISDLGGQVNNLNIAIDQGKAKQPLFGRGGAATEAYLQQQWSEFQQNIDISEFIGAAIQAGYVLDPGLVSNTPGPTFGTPTIDWKLIFPGSTNPPNNWIQIINTVLSDIKQFYINKGRDIENSQNQGRPIPTEDLFITPDRAPKIGSGGEAALAFLAAAAPVLLAIQGIIGQFTGNQGGQPGTPGGPSVPGGSGGFPGSGGISPNTLLFGALGVGALIFLTSKKRR